MPCIWGASQYHEDLEGWRNSWERIRSAGCTYLLHGHLSLALGLTFVSLGVRGGPYSAGPLHTAWWSGMYLTQSITSPSAGVGKPILEEEATYVVSMLLGDS